ncbi:uncharacterized protein DNG_02128 [Cephalotrichum gorgonifer]|uniref:LTD domain-containing protein n=1 Tax=Cephalotrichum gorgonifer TaxID=2041049 RepID=A0AAE8SSZ5_9PEZI|nr:uncharacterized protein DNG_02128 [Cephalotrichum gorgonifer]
MPLEGGPYVVWNATPVEWDTSEARKPPRNWANRWTPHCDLIFTDDNGGRHRTNINVRSSDTVDHRLVFWTGELTRGTEFGKRIISALESERFKDLGYYENPPPLDFLHDGFLDIRKGTIRDTNLPGHNDDVTDALDVFFDANSDEFKRSTVFIWGERYSNSGGGLHQVHMNQGNYKRNPKWYKENGRGQDGGIVIKWPDGKYTYFFIAFAAQASDTDDQGNPKSGNDTKMLRDYIGAQPPVIGTRPVVPGQPDTVKIHSALVNPVGADNTPGHHDRVRVVNRTADPISLDGWTIRNQDGGLKQLPDVLLPGNGAMADLDVGPEAYLANRRDGEIVLKDAGGTEVHRVSYNAADVSEGKWISFPDL